eukprot:CAMPEP_0174894032 /NCGR_PEP_ID=MMETSP0167-20121228/8739_1 /TAXON_ID=38298 /ORGANISM="Rhodella maculata, Strain CCMP736" /LENGTH=256 /DNA_ID=CAMNT_0016132999 /DNA_START=128 /DNA_END=894 /DNA_ORIENTATION=+
MENEKSALPSTLLVVALSLLLDPVLPDNDGVVSLIRLERDLFLGLELLLLQLLHLLRKHDGGFDGGVDAICLDGDDESAAGLQEVVGVERKDPRLVWLGNVREDDVDCADEHAVPQRMPRVLDDGDDVRAALGHLDEVAAGAVRELDGVDDAVGADEVGDVGDGGAGGRAEVEDAGARLDVDVVDAAEDGGGELGSEGVPDAVLDFGGGRPGVGARRGRDLDGDAFLAVDGDPRGEVLGAERVFLSAGDVDAAVAV